MRVRLAKKPSKPQRGGFTLIELLVVISIIAVLASLILPGVQNARATARRMQCLNNMRNVGVAVQNYATNNNGKLPPLVGREFDNGTNVADVSWPVYLLPYLDQSGLYDRIFNNLPAWQTDTTNLINIPVYTCPDDPRSNLQGTLSFVGNGGWYPDTSIPNTISTDTLLGRVRESSSDAVLGSELDYRTAWAAGRGGLDASTAATDVRRAIAATGTMFRGGPSNHAINTRGTTMTLDQIKDGTSQTLLLSENLQAGNWYDITTGHIAFVAPIETGGTTAAPTLTAVPEEYRINDDFASANSGQRPRPSSFHTQVVNVIFADGAGRNLSQNIDQSVYRRLISSNGMARFGEAPLDGNSY